MAWQICDIENSVMLSEWDSISVNKDLHIQPMACDGIPYDFKKQDDGEITLDS